jgi:hypothetical protein
MRDPAVKPMTCGFVPKLNDVCVLLLASTRAIVVFAPRNVVSGWKPEIYGVHTKRPVEALAA